MTGRNRHDPSEPREKVVTLTTRKGAGSGVPYLYGFAGGFKYFAFEDKAQPGTWTLYRQPLCATAIPERPAPVQLGPNGGRIVTAIPNADKPAPYVSALAPDRSRRGRPDG
jgi:hypothetical protein